MRTSSMKILVTGANGFVGTAVCEALLESDIKLRAVSRNPAPDFQDGDVIEWIQVANIDGETDWSEAKLKDIDTIIHLGARVHVIKENESDPRAAFFKTNHEGTKHLSEQASKAGVKRFVFISTAHIHGHVSGDEPFKENSPAKPHTDYAASKWAAEEALQALKAEKKNKMEIVIIRPPLVYGEGVKANFEKLLWLADRPIPLPLKKIENKRSIIYVKNLAHFIVECATAKKLGDQTFLISDGIDISTPNLIATLATAMGKRAILLPFKPEWIFKLAKKFNIEQQVNSLCANLHLDISHAQQLLKWKAPFAQQEALHTTAKWYKTFTEEQKQEPKH